MKESSMLPIVFIAIGLLALVIGLFVWAGASGRLNKARAMGASSRMVDDARAGVLFGRILSGVGLLFTAIIVVASMFVTNGVGEAKVYTNIDGTIAFTQESPGLQIKAPWQDFQDFDLFSQEVLYAGAPQGGGPDYSGGTVNGAEVTVAVGGVNGGSTQANIDISVVYSIDANAVRDIYTEFRSQERFTKQVIEKTILSVVREIPAGYSAVEFRGTSRGEAQDAILELLNERLNSRGVQVDFVNIQNVTYPENVEAALAEVEAANQAAQRAEAELRAAEVTAQQRVVEAQGQADANRILSESLTPALLQQRYIDALSKASTIYVVPDESTPFVSVR